MTDPIRSFTNEHRFLSNFSRVPGDLTALGMRAISVEHIYQAAKTLDIEERTKVLIQRSPGKAKQIGETLTPRPDWDVLKIPIMRAILEAKFNLTDHPDLTQLLLDTGDAELIEGNHWNDLFWGVDSTTWEGENHLGCLLMEIRDQLNNQLRPI